MRCRSESRATSPSRCSSASVEASTLQRPLVSCAANDTSSVVDDEADGDPRNGQRCVDGHDGELMRPAVNDHDRRCLARALRSAHELRIGEARRRTRRGDRVGHDLTIRRDQLHDVGVNARAMVSQCRLDRALVAGRDRFAKREIRREDHRALRESRAIVLDRACEDPLARRELFVDDALGIARIGRVDEQERRALHEREQHDEEDDDPRSQLPQPGTRAAFHGAPSNHALRTRCTASTGSEW